MVDNGDDRPDDEGGQYTRSIQLALDEETKTERNYDYLRCYEVWRGVAWCGVVWCGVAWCIIGVARCRIGVAFRGVA